MLHLLNNSKLLIRHISQVLYEKNRNDQIYSTTGDDVFNPSAVLLLLGQQCDMDISSEPCLILNKRSQKVKQPGDLCCPGGSVSPRLDFYLSKILILPGLGMMRWHYWKQWRTQYFHKAHQMPIFLATGLRESFEEMRLNPFNTQFMGPLPPQRLVMFQRVIFPLTAWIFNQKQFVTNWEVEKVIYIPLRDLLNPDNYARYCLRFESSSFPDSSLGTRKRADAYPCFLYKNEDEQELLWGATYRIVMVFLEMIFGFRPPDMASLPVIFGTLDGNYLTGSGTSEK